MLDQSISGRLGKRATGITLENAMLFSFAWIIMRETLTINFIFFNTEIASGSWAQVCKNTGAVSIIETSSSLIERNRASDEGAWGGVLGWKTAKVNGRCTYKWEKITDIRTRPCKPHKYKPTVVARCINPMISRSNLNTYATSHLHGMRCLRNIGNTCRPIIWVRSVDTSISLSTFFDPKMSWLTRIAGIRRAY